jgi:hypothetical protein
MESSAEWRSDRNGKKGNCYAETRPGHDVLRRGQTSAVGGLAGRPDEARRRLNHLWEAAGSTVGERHLAAGLGRAPRASAANGRFKKSLAMSGELGSLAGDRGVSHERSPPAEPPRRHRLGSRQAGSYPSHYCGCFSRRAVLAYGRRRRNAVTARNVNSIDALEREHRRKDCSSFCQLGPPANTVEQCGPEPRLKLMNGRACSGTRGPARRLMLTSARSPGPM